jgi:hypothetical protein
VGIKSVESEEAEINECSERAEDEGQKEGRASKSRALAVRLDAVAGLPRQARGSRLRAHCIWYDEAKRNSPALP